MSRLKPNCYSFAGAQWNCGALEGRTQGQDPRGNHLRVLHHRPAGHGQRLLRAGLEEEGRIDDRASRVGVCGCRLVDRPLLQIKKDL